MKFAQQLVVASIGFFGAPQLVHADSHVGALLDSNAIADVAEKTVDSVVNIQTEATVEPEVDPFFGSMFGDAGPQKMEGKGSGVIVTANGRILTNAHVVNGAQEITVTLQDGTDVKAKVVGKDTRADLAVIQLEGKFPALKPIPWGDSSTARLGEVVLAIGDGLGVGKSVSMGIVSAKGRGLRLAEYEDFIQTDAAINPGNSGGALINLRGELIGINTAIASRTGGYQGIGLAIPSSMAQPIMESLKKSGKVSRGFLGVGIQDVDRDLATALKLASPTGVLLTEVRAQGPAGKAGLARGDVVTKVDGRAVTSTGQFRNLIASSGAKKKVNLELVRDGKPLALGVELAEVPDDLGQPGETGGAPSAPQATTGGALDGVTLSELTPELRRTLGLSPDAQKGVVVTDLEPRSAAAKAGLRPGDVVLELNRTPVESLPKFKELYGKASGDVLLLVQRHGASVFLVVRK